MRKNGQRDSAMMTLKPFFEHAQLGWLAESAYKPSTSTIAPRPSGLRRWLLNVPPQLFPHKVGVRTQPVPIHGPAVNGRARPDCFGIFGISLHPPEYLSIFIEANLDQHHQRESAKLQISPSWMLGTAPLDQASCPKTTGVFSRAQQLSREAESSPGSRVFGANLLAKAREGISLWQ